MMATPLPKITSAEAIDAHHVRIEFDNGELRLLDMRQFMKKGVFTALTQPSIFKSVRAMKYFLQWPGEIDLSSDTAYLCSQVQERAHENA